MTDDGREHDRATNEPGEIVAGEIVEHAISDIAAADDADAVVAATARAFERLLGTAAECSLHGGDGELIAATSDDTDPPADSVDFDGAATDGDLSWPTDPLVVPAADAGWLACWADTDRTAPSWAVGAIAHAAVDAASQRVRTREREHRIEELEAETDQLANFATIVAHDLRNPLSIAQGHLELARERDDEEHYEKIGDAHDRIQRIIDHTLTMAKQDGDSAPTERVETGAVAHDAWETVETGAATLTVSDSLRVVADRDRLQQLFENLFRNAVEHGSTSPDPQTQAETAEHGVPERQAERGGGTEPPVGVGLAVEVGTLPDDAGFFVADNGPGIPEADQTTVFDQGYSDDGGTGLGLSIIEDISIEHDWSVTVSNGRSGGARFEIVTE